MILFSVVRVMAAVVAAKELGKDEINAGILGFFGSGCLVGVDQAKLFPE